MSENKSPNLPPRLQEKLDDKAEEFECKTNVGRDCYNCNGYSIGLTEGFKAGYRQAYSDILQELGPVVEAISFYADMNSWSNKAAPSDFIYNTIDEDDLGVGDFEQSCGPNHVLNSFSDSNNGGRRAREALKHLKERILTQEGTGG